MNNEDKIRGAVQMVVMDLPNRDLPTPEIIEAIGFLLAQFLCDVHAIARAATILSTPPQKEKSL